MFRGKNQQFRNITGGERERQTDRPESLAPQKIAAEHAM